MILWFTWVVEVESRPERVAAPPFFAVGIGLLLVLIPAVGSLAFGIYLILAIFFATVLSSLIVPDELPEGLDLLLVVTFLILGVLDAYGCQRRCQASQPTT